MALPRSFASLLATLLVAGPMMANEPATMTNDAGTTSTAPTTMIVAPTISDHALALLGDGHTTPVAERLAKAEALLLEAPENAEVWAAVGELREAAGREDDALAAYVKATGLDPTLSSSWHRLGILRKRDRRDMAGAIMAFEKALAHSKTPATTLNEMAVTQAQMGRMADALKTWERALAIDPDWGVLPTNATKAALALGDKKKAAAFFEQTLKAARFEETGVMIYGEALVKDGREKDAVAAYARAIAAHPDRPKFRYYRGMALKDTGDREGAKAEFREAIRIATESGDAATRGTAQKALFAIEHPKDLDKLVKAEKLVQTVSTDPKAVQRDMTQAVTILDGLIATHPGVWEMRQLRGDAQRRLGAPDAAKLDYESVIAQVPEQPDALMSLALMHRDLGELEASAGYARRAVANAQRDARVLVNAAFCLLDAGQCDDARRAANRARTVYPREMSTEPLDTLDDEIKTRCP